MTGSRIDYSDIDDDALAVTFEQMVGEVDAAEERLAVELHHRLDPIDTLHMKIDALAVRIFGTRAATEWQLQFLEAMREAIARTEAELRQAALEAALRKGVPTQVRKRRGTR